MKKLGLAVLAASFAIGGMSASAHHSFATEFDRDRPVSLEGTVTMFEWVNPHTWIHLDVERNGRVESWRVEGGAPSALLRRGWERDSLPAGSEITVYAYRSRDGENRASAAEIQFADGRTLSLANPTTQAIAASERRRRN